MSVEIPLDRRMASPKSRHCVMKLHWKGRRIVGHKNGGWDGDCPAVSQERVQSIHGMDLGLDDHALPWVALQGLPVLDLWVCGVAMGCENGKSMARVCTNGSCMRLHPNPNRRTSGSRTSEQP